MWRYVHTCEMELLHYGVKGMKWGVRRSRVELDRANGAMTSKQHKTVLSRKGPPIVKPSDLRYNSKKMEGYLLNPNHSLGGAKCKFLQTALGYNRKDSRLLHRNTLAAIIGKTPDVITKNEYGTKYTYNTKLIGIDGKTTANVKIAIQLDNLRGSHKIVTIVPGKKDKLL